MKLILEVNPTIKDKTYRIESLNLNVMITPPVDEDYWLFRVKVSEQQGLLAFPKFGTFGIGFAKEEDWNTNLPYDCDTRKIYDHIQHNKLDADEEDCLKAIIMLKQACEATQN